MSPDRLGVSILRICLGLLPRRVREEYADEIVEVARRRARERARERRRRSTSGESRGSDSGPRASQAGVRFWLREIGSVLGTVAAAWIDDLASRQTSSTLFDLRTAVRGLLRRPLFTASTLLVLALGIGATAGVGGLGWAVLGASLPYPEADRLVRLFHDDDLTFGVSLNELIRYDRASRTLSGIGGWVTGDATMTDELGATRVRLSRVTPDLLAVLGRRPLTGRPFAPDGARPEAILSHRFWQRRFGGSPDVVGSSVDVDDESHEIVGVLPPDVVFPDPATDVYLPIDLTSDRGEGRGGLFLDVVARLAPGVELETAAGEVDLLAGAMRRADPAAYEAEEDFGGRLAPFREIHTRGERPLLVALGAGTGALFLATCLTVGLLIQGRERRRSSEMAVRRALGASVAALTRLRLIEVGVLAIGGTLLAAVVAAFIGPALGNFFPESVALAGTDPAWATLGGLLPSGALAVMLLAVLVVPGLDRSGDEVSGSRTSTARSGPLRYLLPASQVALASVLLTGSLLLLHTVRALVSTDLGYRIASVTSGRVSLPELRYPGAEEQRHFFEGLLERIDGDARIRAAGLVNALPLSGYGGSGDVYVESVSPDSALDVVTQRVASPGYFAAVGIPLLAGRMFGSDDRSDALRVALVDEVFADRWFGEPEAAVGRRVRFFFGGEEWNEIVGVVGHVQHDGPAVESEGQVYVPFAQRPVRSVHVVAHHRGPSGPIAAALRSAVDDMNPGVPFYDVAPMRDRLRSAIRLERTALAVFSAFGTFALLLAVSGTYGVVALSQEERTREFVLRRALGAPALSVAREVVRDGAAGVGGGILLGGTGAVAMAVVLDHTLVTVRGGHLSAIAGAVLLMLLTGIVAAIVPVHRALRSPPGVLLRGD